MRARTSSLIIAAVALCAFAPLSHAVPVYSAQFGGLTFTFTQTGSQTLNFEIAGTPSNADGAGWAGAAYLGAFDLKDLGLDFSSVTGTATGPGTGTMGLTGLRGQLSASASGVNCNTNVGETGSICFNLDPDYALGATPIDLNYSLAFTGDLAIADAGPHLQILFLDSADGSKVGSLYSQNVGVGVPEPSSGSLFLLGFAFLGLGMWTKRRRAAAAAAVTA